MQTSQQSYINNLHQDTSIVPFLNSEETEPKINLFIKGLKIELEKKDTLEKSIEKITKMALACEFGASFAVKPKNRTIINSIEAGILSDAQLKRQALIIIDHFTEETHA